MYFAYMCAGVPNAFICGEESSDPGRPYSSSPVSFGLYLIYALIGQTPSIFLIQRFWQRTLPGPLSHRCPNSLRILGPGASYPGDHLVA